MNTKTITKRCMETDKPLISILMAVYEPRMDWLKAQLDSLEAQTYPNLRLHIRDDCSPTVRPEEILACVEQCIHSFPFTFERNEKNLGSTGTFELLTSEAEGEYFAYCDQDDVWLPQKLSVLEREIENSGALVVCSDMYIIDEHGRTTAESITRVRRHHVFHSGSGLAPSLLVRNFVVGCTMLIRADVAREAIPFCPYMVHDHFLALYSATKGDILALPMPLIQYRIHSANQTLVMAGVKDRESYLRIRIEALQKRLAWLAERFAGETALCDEIRETADWAAARNAYLHGDLSAAEAVWTRRRFGLAVSSFELVMGRMPEALFMRFIDLSRKNRL